MYSWLLALGSATPRCVLHVGPPKTGTTTLQESFIRLRSKLVLDNWQQPQLPGRHVFPKNAANLAFFLQQRTSTSNQTDRAVWQAFESWLERQAAQGAHVLISAEGLSSAAVNITLLAAALRPFSTHIVLGYRPYYSWLASMHRQMWDATHTRCAAAGNTRPCTSALPLARWLTRDRVVTMASPRGMFTTAALQRYASHFGAGAISVLPLDEALLESFACSSSVLHARHTCGAIRHAHTHGTHPTPLTPWDPTLMPRSRCDPACAAPCAEQSARAARLEPDVPSRVRRRRYDEQRHSHTRDSRTRTRLERSTSLGVPPSLRSFT
jgi:hypothetical protein